MGHYEVVRCVLATRTPGVDTNNFQLVEIGCYFRDNSHFLCLTVHVFTDIGVPNTISCVKKKKKKKILKHDIISIVGFKGGIESLRVVN